LSLAVVAEGIEAQSQMTMLQEMGCEMAQGFLVGKPSPAEVAESLLGGERASMGQMPAARLLDASPRS
jgi:EAL domain-containing protein (putative c-di-GMP-specific phosphodiesterase class I)